jgi:hypothetical protein
VNWIEEEAEHSPQQIKHKPLLMFVWYFSPDPICFVLQSRKETDNAVLLKHLKGPVGSSDQKDLI